MFLKNHNTKYKLLSTSKSKGLTMIELLIVIAILALLFIVMMWYLRNQPYKARDARRKSDITQYMVEFEDYFNDNESYPPVGSIDNCNSTDMAPYSTTVRCDPRPGEIPYDYITDATGIWYAICADLENDSDPDIERIGCGGGCGTGSAYDYCVAVGTSLSSVGSVVTADPSVGEGLNGAPLSCWTDGGPVCQTHDPAIYNCQYTWNTQGECESYCFAGSPYNCD